MTTESVAGSVPGRLLLLAELPDAAWSLLAPLRQQIDEGAVQRLHCTLFRHLPGPSAPALVADLRARVRPLSRPAMRIGAPVARERSVRLPVHAPELAALRDELAERWAAMLLPAERAPPPLHITLASGLQPVAAKRLAQRLNASNHRFIRRRLAVPALLLTPWQPEEAWASAPSPLLRAAFGG